MKHITIYARRSCGCCEAEMSFESKDSALKAFEKAGLCSAATVIDDTGKEYEDIDTFYGFSCDEKEQAEKSLGYLLEKVISGTNRGVV